MRRLVPLQVLGRAAPALAASVLLAAAAPASTPPRAPTHPGGPPPAPRPQDSVAPAAVTDLAPEALDFLLEPVRERHGLPALAALVLQDGAIAAEGAVGRRRVDQDVAVTTADAWHLGSCTKSMTATLAALFVAEGRVAWDTTVADVFPDVPMDAAWRAVTLETLLTNTSGAPQVLPRRPDGRNPTEERRGLVESLLSLPLSSPPGTRYEYSNAGFALAGAMLETRAGASFEELLAARLFEPLGMAGAGFGAPGTRPVEPGGPPDQPLGHVRRKHGPHPVELGPGDDNPPAITPAGRVHAPLAAWARYAGLHLAGARGAGLEEPFDAVDFASLHRPRLERYAMGWVATEVPGRGRRLWHNGSNQYWYCEIVLFPDADLAVLVATNTASGTTEGAVREILRTLEDRFLLPKPSGSGKG